MKKSAALAIWLVFLAIFAGGITWQYQVYQSKAEQRDQLANLATEIGLLLKEVGRVQESLIQARNLPDQTKATPLVWPLDRLVTQNRLVEPLLLERWGDYKNVADQLAQAMAGLDSALIRKPTQADLMVAESRLHFVESALIEVQTRTVSDWKHSSTGWDQHVKGLSLWLVLLTAIFMASFALLLIRSAVTQPNVTMPAPAVSQQKAIPINTLTSLVNVLPYPAMLRKDQVKHQNGLALASKIFDQSGEDDRPIVDDQGRHWAVSKFEVKEVGQLWLAKDVTDQVSGESEQLLAASIFDKMSSPLLVVAPDRRILLANPAFSQMMNENLEQIIGATPDRWNYPQTTPDPWRIDSDQQTILISGDQGTLALALHSVVDDQGNGIFRVGLGQPAVNEIG